MNSYATNSDMPMVMTARVAGQLKSSAILSNLYKAHEAHAVPAAEKDFNRRNIGNWPSERLFDVADPVMKASVAQTFKKAEETFRQIATNGE